MKIIRRPFTLGISACCLLLLSLAPAYGQMPPPRSYFFVELKDTAGEAITDAAVIVSDVEGKQLFNTKTNKDGTAKGDLHAWSTERHYDLNISKAGYQLYEQVLFLYPLGYASALISRVDELSTRREDMQNALSQPIRIVLNRVPITPAEHQAAEIEEQKHQLLLATKRGDAASVRKLLQAGVSAKTVDGKGVPAIAWAALVGDTETIRVLLAAGSDVRNKDNLGHQALLIYLSEGIFRDNKTLTSNGSAKSRPEEQQETVLKLIAAGADVNVQNSYRGTVLNRAISLTPPYAYSLNIETIKALLSSGASVSARDETGRTPLMAAAQYQAIEIIKILLTSGANQSINAIDMEGRTVLMFASQTLLAGVIKNLLEAGAAINAKDNRGQTPLMYAPNSRYENSLEIFRLLLASGANVNDVNQDGQTALLQVAARNDPGAAKLLLKAGANATINARDKWGKTALHHGLSESTNDSSTELVSLLLAAGADPNSVADDGQTPLLLAAQARYGDHLKVLLAAGARTSIEAKDKQGATALLLAARSGRVDWLKALLAAGASLNARDKFGQAALMYARSPEAVTFLIAAGLKVNDASEFGQTPLMYAAMGGSTEVIKILLDAGAAIEAKNKEGKTALMCALPLYKNDSRLEVFKALIAAGANVNVADESGQTVLMLAAQAGFAEIVRILLESKPSVNAKDKQGRTALILATRDINATDTVKLLLDAGADPNIVDNEGRTALMEAAAAPDAYRNYYVGNIKQLLMAGANANLADKKGRTALMLAKEAGNWTIIKLLEEAAKP